ncbi:MAG: hypothetical protein JKY53_07245 [Flavobacteriales bacterium]|nr:hypothetical protein [Flavobacteriales bacterium]
MKQQSFKILLSCALLLVGLGYGCRKDKAPQENVPTCNDGIKNGNEIFVDCGLNKDEHCGSSACSVNIQVIEELNSSNSSITESKCEYIAEDKYGNVWISTYANGGLYKYDGQRWINYDSTQSGLLQRITSILVASDSTMWLTSSYFLYQYDGINWTTFSRDSIGAPFSSGFGGLLEASTGEIYFTSSTELIRYDGTTFTEFNFPQGIKPYTQDYSSPLIDCNDNIYIETEAKGLLMYSNGNGISLITKDNSNLVDNDIWGFVLDNDCNVWGQNDSRVVEVKSGNFIFQTEENSVEYTGTIQKTLTENGHIMTQKGIIWDKKFPVFFQRKSTGENFEYNQVIYKDSCFWFTTDYGVVKATILFDE